MQASIDVLIPVYNAALTVREAVGSIREQSIENIAIHIVDDGSTDGTSAILAELASEDARILIHAKPNGGIVDALNYGLSFCSAPYIARHDADDVAYPQRLQVQLDYLEAHADCVAVGSAVRHIDEHGNCLNPYVSLPDPSNADPYSYPSREPYIIHPFLMARREAVQKVGGYRYAHNSEDTDLYWRLQRLGTLHNLEDCLGDYRLHGASISGSSLKNGRLMAVFSQLAAISAQRLLAGAPDIAFSKSLMTDAKACKSLSEIIELCATALDLGEAERRYLALSAGAKLMELTSYRPYEIEPEDSRYIRQTLAESAESLDAGSHSSISGQITGTAAALTLKRHFQTAFALLSPDHYPAFAYKLGWRLAVPEPLRRKIRARMLAASFER